MTELVRDFAAAPEWWPLTLGPVIGSVNAAGLALGYVMWRRIIREWRAL